MFKSLHFKKLKQPDFDNRVVLADNFMAILVELYVP